MATDTNISRVLTPVMVASFGLGGAVFGPVSRLSTEHNASHLVLIGLSVSLAALAIMNATAARTIKHTPQLAESSNDEVRHFANVSIIPLWLMFFLGSAAGLTTLGLASSIVESNGASAALSSMTLGGVALANTIGRLSVAGLNRKFQVQSSIQIAMFWLALGTLICATASGAYVVSLGLILIALGYGTLASAIPCRTEELFGPLRFKKVYGIIFTAWGLAGLSAPWLGGILFEKFNTFTLVFTLAFSGVMLAVCLSFIKQKQSGEV